MNTGPHLVIKGTILVSIILVILFSMATDHIRDGSFTHTTSPPQTIALAAQADHAEFTKNQCDLNLTYPDEILKWCSFITDTANKTNLPANLIAAIIQVESNGNPSAISKSGAVGLMQVMPRDGKAASFQCINGPCFAGRPTTEELLDPEFNLSYGARLLTSLYSKTNNIREALFRYGPMDVGYSYADLVLSVYNHHNSFNPSP